MIFVSSQVYFFYILKCLWLASFGFKLNAVEIETGIKEFIQLALAMAVWGSLSVIHCKSLDMFDLPSGVQSTLLDTLWSYQIVLQHLLAFFNVIYNFCKRKHIESYPKSISKFDSCLDRLQWFYKVKQPIRIMPLIMFLASVSVMGPFIVYESTLFHTYGHDLTKDIIAILINFGHVFNNMFFLMLSFQFIVSVRSVNIRMAALLENIR